MKKLISLFMVILLVFGIAGCTPAEEVIDEEPAVSAPATEDTLENPTEDSEVEIEDNPETAVWYVDTTIVSMLDDINADAETASSLWLNVNVAIAGCFGGLDEDNISGFYLTSNDMNYAFEYIYCNMNYENILSELENTALDTSITIYGEVVSVSGTEGYTINVERIEVKN